MRPQQGNEIMSMPEQARKQLLMENKKRFMEGERIGHMEDLLVSTILDPWYWLKGESLSFSTGN